MHVWGMPSAPFFALLSFPLTLELVFGVGVCRVSDAGVRAAVTHCPHLTRFELYTNINITNKVS